MVVLGLSGFCIGIVGGWSALFVRWHRVGALVAMAWLVLLAAISLRIGLALPSVLAGFAAGAAAHAAMLHAIRTGGIAR